MGPCSSGEDFLFCFVWWEGPWRTLYRKMTWPDFCFKMIVLTAGQRMARVGWLEWKRRRKDSVVWSGSSGGGKESQIWEVLQRLNQPIGFPTEYDSKVRDPSNWVTWGAIDCHGQCGGGAWEGKLEVWSGTCQHEMLLRHPGGMSSGQLAHMSDLQRLKDHIPLWVASAEMLIKVMGLIKWGKLEKSQSQAL